MGVGGNSKSGRILPHPLTLVMYAFALGAKLNLNILLVFYSIESVADELKKVVSVGGFTVDLNQDGFRVFSS